MNDIAHRLSGLLTRAADRLEYAFGTVPSVITHELYFDSDAYLADLKNRIYTRYY